MKLKTTRLCLDVDYDPRQTDPESLCSALDLLLETAMSTPYILEEYGPVQVGHFCIDPLQVPRA